jgi:hypothetical protein
VARLNLGDSEFSDRRVFALTSSPTISLPRMPGGIASCSGLN